MDAAATSEQHPTPWPCYRCMPGPTLDATSWLPAASKHYRIVWLQWANEYAGLVVLGGSAAIGRSFAIQTESRALRVSVQALKCPVCGALARQRQDIDQGYCGNCHWWTFDPVMVVGWLEELASKAELGYDLAQLVPRPRRIKKDEIELWAFCDDEGCQEHHEPDEFKNRRHRLPEDHPRVRQLNDDPAKIDPGA